MIQRPTFQLIIIFLLGISSGFPLALTATGGTFQAFATANGFNLSQLGALTILTLPYALKFLWAPLLDRYRCPGLAFLGFRRSWLVFSQAALALLYFKLGTLTSDNYVLALVLFLISFISATQDIAVDAYRAEVLTPNLRGAGASLAVIGYRIGMILSGAGALALGGELLTWSTVLSVCGLVQLVAIIPSLLAPSEPIVERPRSIRSAIILPFSEFISRRGAFEILFFIFLFKAPDAVGTLFTTRFLLDCGFSKPEIAAVLKGVGLLSVLIGGVGAGWLMLKMSLKKALLGFGILQGLTVVPFVILAGQAVPNHLLLVAVVTAESLGAGASGTVFVAFLMALCRNELAATQFALLSSIAALARSVLGPAAGYLADSVGWKVYFLMAGISNLPALLLLISRGKKWQLGSHENLS